MRDGCPRAFASGCSASLTRCRAFEALHDSAYAVQEMIGLFYYRLRY